jgi:GTP-binding protein
MDVEGSKDNLAKFKEKVDLPIYEVSALNNEGLDKVLIALADKLDTIEKQPLYEEERFESHVLYKFKQEQPFTVTKDSDGAYVIRGDEIEKIYKMTWFVTDEAFLRFSNKLRKLGIDDKLKEMGIQNGDIVRILDYEFEYRE